MTEPIPLTHRETLRIMLGLLSALGTAMIGATVIANALPAILLDLGGSPTELTLIFVASLTAMTVTMPIWGKLSDQLDKKRLMQVALVIFVVGSMLCGTASSAPWLIGFRLIQGAGMGGVTVLTQTILASVIPPRIRGRYNGYYGAVTTTATVSGPLVGGLIVDAPGLGWRWVFFVCVPLAVGSLVLLQRFLKIQHVPATVRFDYAGAMTIAGSIGLLLTWITFGGELFAWRSWASAGLVGSALALLAATVLVERRAADPLIPVAIIRERTTALAIVASMVVGMSVFGASVFLAQYFQSARGISASLAGILVAPMMLGSLLGAVASGQLITRFGRWRRFLLAGAISLVSGLTLASTMSITGSLWTIVIAEVLIGLGMGLLMQNLVLAVQNTVDLPDVGTASAAVAFMRSLGGTMGVAILGALLASRLGTLEAAGVPTPDAYAQATGSTFLAAAAIAVLAVLAVLAIRETPLRTTIRKTPAPDPQPLDSAQ
ncbi:MFS transporter [Tomitella biformata]|uniref:MFS transporter n=1 Tax=Tomitella biformata TaxID=630403 RepID=UPI0004ADA670|nr:MFS transporter [Tomitella biformata]